ncbi:MAG: discoidin domain-containing protein [Protaetiibacter sp.]
MNTRARARLPWLALITAVAVASLAAPLAATAAPADAPPSFNISKGRPATASTTEGGYVAQNAVDDDLNTRWSSLALDDQWIEVDLGVRSAVTSVQLRWEAAYARGFRIELSDDRSDWEVAATVTDGTGGLLQTVPATGEGRYLRLVGTERATIHGISLWELRVLGYALEEPEPQPCSTEVAQGRPASASSTQGGLVAGLAVDEWDSTRWGSEWVDDAWIQVDLGASTPLCRVELDWETAYAKSFRIDVSDDGTNWTTLRAVTDGSGGRQALEVSGSGRYVRIVATERGTAWGYSLWGLRVFAADDGPSTPPVQGGGDLGPNVHVFDDATSDQSIQAALDAAFAQQESDQFGDGRYQFLFKPGSYDVHAQVGFYTSVNGLGLDPTDVAINGGVWVDAQWFDGNATQNFWRSAENLTINPHTGEARWAVAQAAPFRRIQVNGDLNLAPSSYGWASGGFIADSRVTGTVRSYSQQQWLTRDSSLGAWEGSVWNMVFSGVEGAPAAHFPNPSHTVLDESPVVREKPYLYWDATADDFAVFVPSLTTDARGVSWADGHTPGSSVPLDDFYVAQPGVSAATINRALAQGLHLLLTPGVYHLDDTIHVTRPDTIVLGLGYATIVNEGGVAAMRVADVDGVKIAGVLFDAGTVEAPVLLEVGEAGSSADHAADPISLHDVFFRVGGAVAGKVRDALVVNSDDTLIDHIWSWRGDHGAGIGWNVNTARNGLVVNGDDVTAYGLFVEHYQQNNTVWNGERGRTVFYQSELAYDPPNQAAWMDGSRLGWSSYRVGDDVTQHEAWGIGAYSYNAADPTIVTESGFQAPDRPGIRLRNLLTVSLGGNGIIRHVVNGIGDEASGVDTIPSYLAAFH